MAQEHTEGKNKDAHQASPFQIFHLQLTFNILLVLRVQDRG